MTEHQRESEWNVADWHGKMLVDCNGGKIGELQDVLRRRGDRRAAPLLPVLRLLAESVHAGQDIRCTRQPAAPTLATGFPATSSVAATDDRAAIRA